jgi:hypothetical protein
LRGQGVDPMRARIIAQLELSLDTLGRGFESFWAHFFPRFPIQTYAEREHEL